MNRSRCGYAWLVNMPMSEQASAISETFFVVSALSFGLFIGIGAFAMITTGGGVVSVDREGQTRAVQGMHSAAKVWRVARWLLGIGAVVFFTLALLTK
jgi:hypothetical protein